MRKLLVAAAVTLLADASRLQAQPAPAPAIETIPAPRLARDTERGRGEHGPHRPRLFISPSGEPFRGGGGLAAWFAQADADHDGSVTLAEFQADALRAFRLYDANGDGVIDGFEIQAYERERAPEIAEIMVPGEEGGERDAVGGEGSARHGDRRRGGARGEPAEGGDRGGSDRTVGVGREGAARFSLLNEPEPLLAADEDVDGKVTLAEWTRASARRFAKLDRDHVGRLTMAELSPQKPKR